MRVNGLAVVVVGPDPARARSALGLAAAAAALGRKTAVLFDGGSVSALAWLSEPLATALDLGVSVTACATGLADLDITPPEGVETGGMLAFLAANRQSELLAV